MNKRITPDNITSLKPNEIFVFGSNEAGIHGAGAALLALKKFGAVWRQGIGSFGQTYAIPTKDCKIITLDIGTIQVYVSLFHRWAKCFPDNRFLVTEIGCGLAGYRPLDIAPLFRGCVNLRNVYLPRRFWAVIEGES